MIASLCEHLDEEVPEGLGAEAREARLVAIESELDVLERQEEALIEQSELSESPVMRRADARPEIILGTHDVPEVPARSPHYMGRAKSDVPYERRRMAIEPEFPNLRQQP